MSDGGTLAQLYREVILSNAAEPCGHGVDIDATHRASGNNPVCGDEVEIFLRVEDGVIREAAFDGESCAICMASGSLLCRHLPGQGTQAVEQVPADFEAAIADGGDEHVEAYMKPMLGVRAYPSRVNCALLPWQTAQKALDGEEG